MKCFSTAIVLFFVLLGQAQALLQGSTAIVERIEGSAPGVEEMDFVRAGLVINLGANDTIILSYLKSCERETITGATVIVGSEQSDVQGGKVVREKIICDGGQLQMTKELLGKTAGAVFRAPPNKGTPPLLSLRPQFMLYGRSPVVELSPEFPVIIERVDRPGERYELVPDSHKMKGAFYDFADDNRTLAAAGVYRATMGPAQVLFQVGLNAGPGRTTLGGRLLLLPSHD